MAREAATPGVALRGVGARKKEVVLGAAFRDAFPGRRGGAFPALRGTFAAGRGVASKAFKGKGDPGSAGVWRPSFSILVLAGSPVPRIVSPVRVALEVTVLGAAAVASASGITGRNAPLPPTPLPGPGAPDTATRSWLGTSCPATSIRTSSKPSDRNETGASAGRSLTRTINSVSSSRAAASGRKAPSSE